MKKVSKIFKGIAGILLGGFAILVLTVVFSAPSALGHITQDTPAPTSRFQNYTFFATTTSQVITAGTLYATSTNATSTNIYAFADGNNNNRIDNGYFVVQGADAVNMYFSRGGATGPNLGQSKFNIQVSPDGTNWYDFQRMKLLDGSGTATSTVWITAATSTVVTSIDLRDQAFYAIRCIVVEVTDGEHTCKASAAY